jgi:hypothetical protein
VSEAYDVLGDAHKRACYDCELVLAASAACGATARGYQQQRAYGDGCRADVGTDAFRGYGDGCRADGIYGFRDGASAEYRCEARDSSKSRAYSSANSARAYDSPRGYAQRRTPTASSLRSPVPRARAQAADPAAGRLKALFCRRTAFLCALVAVMALCQSALSSWIHLLGAIALCVSLSSTSACVYLAVQLVSAQTAGRGFGKPDVEVEVRDRVRDRAWDTDRVWADPLPPQKTCWCDAVFCRHKSYS